MPSIIICVIVITGALGTVLFQKGVQEPATLGVAALGCLLASAAAATLAYRLGLQRLSARVTFLEDEIEKCNAAVAVAENEKQHVSTVKTRLTVIARSLSETLLPGKVLRASAEQMRTITGCSRALIWLRDGTGALRLASAFEWAPEATPEEGAPLQQPPESPSPLVQHAADKAVLLDRENVRMDVESSALAHHEKRPFLIAPIRFQGGVMGVLEFQDIRLLGEEGGPVFDRAATVDFLAVLTGAALKHARALEEARRRANLDDLTEVYRQRYLDEFLRNGFGQSPAAAREYSMAVVRIEHLASLASQRGQPLADKLLSDSAHALHELLRSEGDLVARHGTDGFACLLSDTSPARASALAAAIRASLAAQFPSVGTDDGSLEVTVGVASSPVDTQSPEALLQLADQRAHH